MSQRIIKIFFNAIFIAMAGFGMYLSFCDAYSFPKDSQRVFIFAFIFSVIACILMTDKSFLSNIVLFILNLGIAVIIISKYELIGQELERVYLYIDRQYRIYNGYESIRISDLDNNATFSICIILALAISLIAAAVLRFKSRFIMLLPIASLVLMELFHGKALLSGSAFCIIFAVTGLLFGMMLEEYGGSKRFIQRGYDIKQIFLRYVIFLIVMSGCFILAFFAENALKEMVFKHSDKVLEKQHKIEKDIIKTVNGVKKKINKEFPNYLTNNAPNQYGEIVMYIETDRKPEEEIYIKGYTAGDYGDGKWKEDKTEDADFDEKYINSMFYNGISSIVSEYNSDGFEEYDLYSRLQWLRYISKASIGISMLDDTTAEYVPYIADSYSVKKEYSKVADLNIMKYSVIMEDQDIESQILSITDDEAALYDVKEDEKYTAYVYGKYLEVPDGIERVRKLADDILNSENLSLQCMAVKNAICRDTEYSQNLKSLPKESDYIEYFLFEQKKGYCEHYATAGTILLRLKGIPARYVSGYCVSPDDFKAVKDGYGSEKYVAYIKDYSAHAWTEVYKKGYGWIPYEMTKGLGVTREVNLSAGSSGEPEISETVKAEETSKAAETSESTVNPGLSAETASPRKGEATQKPKAGKKAKTGNNKGQTQEPDETEGLNGAENDSEDVKDREIDNTRSNNKESEKSSKVYNDIYKVIIIVVIIAFIPVIILFLPVAFAAFKFKVLLKKSRNVESSNERIIIYFGIFNEFLELCRIDGISKMDDKKYISRLCGVFGDCIPKEEIYRYERVLQQAVFSNKMTDKSDEEAIKKFMRKAGEKAVLRCGRFRRIIIRLLFRI